jgi:hypothetical protein
VRRSGRGEGGRPPARVPQPLRSSVAAECGTSSPRACALIAPAPSGPGRSFAPSSAPLAVTALARAARHWRPVLPPASAPGHSPCCLQPECFTRRLKARHPAAWGHAAYNRHPAAWGHAAYNNRWPWPVGRVPQPGVPSVNDPRKAQGHGSRPSAHVAHRRRATLFCGRCAPPGLRPLRKEGKSVQRSSHPPEPGGKFGRTWSVFLPCFIGG